METDRKGLISLRNGKDGTINCHTVRYNSLWWSQWQKTRQRKCPSCLFMQNIQISQHGKTPFFPGLSIHVVGEEKQQLLGEGGGGRRKRKEEEEVSYLNHKCLPLFPSNKLKGCVLGIPRGKNKPTAFLSSSRLLSALPHRPGPAKWETAALRSVENCVLSALETRRWNTGGQRREDPDRKQEGSTAPSPRAAK